MVERSIGCDKAEKDSGSRTFPLAKGNTMGETHTNNLVHPFSWSQFRLALWHARKQAGLTLPWSKRPLLTENS